MNLKNKIKNVYANAKLNISKHSPEMLVVVGVVGTVTATVMACRATTKISSILDNTKENIDKIHETVELAKDDNSIDYTEEDSKKDLTIIYAKTGLEIAKLYLPSVILGTLSISSILASNNILKKRNTALAAAYATIDKGFKEYRSRVVERFGKEVDKELKYGFKTQEVEETIIDEKGKEKKVKKSINVVDPDSVSPYAVYFTRSNPYWDNVPEYREFFLNSQQSYSNDMLISKKFVALNEVYKSLGFPETKAGMVVGWRYDEKNPTGDNFIEFHVEHVYLPSADGENYEEAYLIDFNVDGNIYSEM